MPLRFTLRQLEYFVAVGEGGSVAQASGRVNVSSPSISAAIAQLETEFGVQLFVRRHAHALVLTGAGRQLIGEARKLLAQAEALTVLASDIGGEVSGPIAVGCLTTFAPLILPTLRQAFETAHPRARVTQYELDHADILERAHGLPAKRQRPMLAEADRLLVVIRAYHAQAAVLEAAQIRHQAAVA